MIRAHRFRGFAIAAVALLAAGATARAQDFHGFDPGAFSGAMLSADQLKAMVADAKAATPPRNGSGYVIGFANLQRDISFGVKVEGGIKANADAAGVELAVADNRLDGPTALANAESFVRRNADFVIEFQTDVNFGPAVMNQFDTAGIKVAAIDIPMPNATFFGANNPRSGFMGGSYLAQAAIAEYGADKVPQGYLVVGELPQSGAIPAMRTGGQVAGFQAELPDFPADHILKIDTKNTLQESFQQMSNLIGRIPAGVPIMVTAINDQAATGMLRAAQQAGREADTIVVGMGADETETLAKEPRFVASVGYFPERYGNYLIPIALATLANKPLPPAVLVNHVMVTKANICEFYPDAACAKDAKVVDYKFPQEAFAKHLAALRGLEELKGYETLIPKE
ncbi:sugar ABC transporter substrate-binding protein [Inquilinus sp. CA228]|uniref:sugar ABC transporter substrate-binding protein n=1 Tax=Inquilinus sp. CA228 TaxID=3455609 RepID=UPI003F8D1E4E